MLANFDNSEIRRRIKELSEHENFKDFIIYSPLSETWGGVGQDEETKKSVQEYLNTSINQYRGAHKRISERFNFWGITPYAKRHPIMEKFAFSKEINLGEYVFKKIPEWFESNFPRNFNTLTKIVWSIIDYDVFDSGVFPSKVWAEARKRFPSPMDRKELSKPKLGNVIKHLVDGGIASKNLEDKYNSRIKTKDSFELINCSSKPEDFIRLSTSSDWSSCVNQSGQYNETIWCYMINPTKGVIYIDSKNVYKANPLKSPKARCSIHLAGLYDCFYKDRKISSHSSQDWSNSVMRAINNYLYNGDKDVFNYKVVLLEWHIVPDRVYAGSNSMLAPVLASLFQRCEELGIKLSVPSNYNSNQDGSTRANFKFNQSAVLVTPVVTSIGWKNYSDNFGDKNFSSFSYIGDSDFMEMLPFNIFDNSGQRVGNIYSQYISASNVKSLKELESKFQG